MTVGDLKVAIGAELTDFDRKMAEMQRKMRNNAKQSENTWNTWSKKIAGYMAAAFTVDAVAQTAKQIFNVTAEFQKMGAVLSNTLGNEAKATAAMDQIKTFAAETPFSVIELTNAFVKLANQGFQPTMEQMRLMGDVASSTGKSFDQLTEAIIDAQTGEFERLKEFGIRASKVGDKVTFTFKEQKTQVDFTASSIQEYILSLGELEGVAGANAKISETLSGKLSNLNDAVDNLYNTIGSGADSPMSNLLDIATDLVKKLDTAAGVLSTETVPWYEKLAYALSNTTVIGKAWAKIITKLTGHSIDSAAAIEEWQIETTYGADAAFNFAESMREMFGVMEKGTEMTEGQKKAMEKYREVVNRAESQLADFQRRQEEMVEQQLQDSLPGTSQSAMGALLGQGEQANLGGLANIPFADDELFEAMSANVDAFGNKIKETQKEGKKLSDIMGNTLVNAIGKTGSASVQFGETMSQAIKDIIVQMVKLIVRTVVIRGLLKGIFGGLTGGLGFAFPSIPGLAEGGIVTGPTLAMVGEGREAEAVLPLSKLDSMLNSGMGGGGMMEARIVGAGDDLIVYLQRAQNRRKNFT